MTIFKHSDEVQEKIDGLFGELQSAYPLVFVDDVLENVDSLIAIMENDTEDEVQLHLTEIEELVSLLKFKNEFQEYNTEWSSGADLVHMNSREEYIKRYVDGTLRDIPSFFVIDWDQSAENFFSEGHRQIELNGDTYYVVVN